MKIEILYFAGCPHHEPTAERVREVLASLAVEADLAEVEVRTGSEAERLHFPGSPTVRVDGVDIEPDVPVPGPGALGCRLYGGSGIPPRDLLVDAVGRARAGRGTGAA